MYVKLRSHQTNSKATSGMHSGRMRTAHFGPLGWEVGGWVGRRIGRG